MSASPGSTTKQSLEKGPVLAHWQALLASLHEGIDARGAHAARILVLVPYAQLMPLAMTLWARTRPDGYAPRFETTRSWARQLAPFSPSADDLVFDAARDVLVARDLLDRAGLGHVGDLLVGRLVEAATQVAASVAAVPPPDRGEWAQRAQVALAPADAAPALAYEQAVARIAVAWAAASSYETDVLFTPRAGDSFDALFILEGVQHEPLTRALAARWADRAHTLPLRFEAPHGALRFHVANDGEDEAERAAACVLAHLEADRVPVALAATDRALVRRVRALLGSRGVAIRDENGWKLSTTRAAAQLMLTLRACAWNASCDAVLDWVKAAPAWRSLPLQTFESWLRRQGWRDWWAVERWLAAGDAGRDGEHLLVVARAVASARELSGGARPLPQWLTVLRELLRRCGLYAALDEDHAGARVLTALRLEEGAQGEFDALRGAGRRLTLVEFTAWVDTVLEAAHHVPPHPAREQVVILPVSQMLARPFAALVWPGCDEVRLPAAPEPPGAWTAAQRAALGLPGRDELATAHRAAWQLALQTPWCDLLWRTGDDKGEPLLASPLVEALRLDGHGAESGDPRGLRDVATQPVTPPTPRGECLPIPVLSASAYDDLRACPYRFFSLRLLGLKEAEELEADIDKRDFGLWLHAVLRRFHERLRDQDLPAPEDRVALIDQVADEVAREHGLDEGEFLPFAASWPAVRDGYLAWLSSHEAEGGRFQQAESWQEMPLSRWRLAGRIDRIDRTADGQTLVIDYKTEARQRTAERVRDATEDTQLAFYAALLPDDSLRAAYLNLGEREGTKLYEQVDVTRLRDGLLDSILHDLGRIADGAALPALGEGLACEYCAARGLCRRDFWAQGASAVCHP